MDKGFSLVELSIVLVILGLLTGGILTGQNLIRAAELRAATTQLKSFQAATMTFRDKYFALPGDMTNATDFWGVAAGSGNDSTCYNVASSNSATCNGNGDGILNFLSSWYGAINVQRENFQAWQHLANAGMIEGSYSGRSDSTTSGNIRTPGLNVPHSRISGTTSGVSLPYIMTGHSSYFTSIDYNYNVVEIGRVNPEENWNIDKKIDDGSPVTGRVIAPRSDAAWALNCTTATDTTAEYNLEDKSGVCSLLARFY